MEQKRLDWLDIARGICMLCMVVTHYYAWKGGDSLFIGIVGTWFLVFFFFSAGLCFRPRRNIGRFAARQAARLLVPYLAVTVVMLVYRCARQGLWYDCSLFARLHRGLASVVYALPAAFEDVPVLHTSTVGIGPIWFLPCFFVASVLYQLISRLPFRLPLALVLAGVATWSQSRVVLPFTLQDACIGCAFIALGDFCRPYVLRYAEWLGEKAWPHAAALTLGSYCTLLVGLTLLPGQGIDLGSNYYNPLSLFSSCVGFWFVISAAVLVRRTAVADEFLAFCGRNSFAILILHNMDILGIRNWAGTDATFLVCTLLVYPFLVYLFRRAQAARKQPSAQPPASPERQMAGVGAEP